MALGSTVGAALPGPATFTEMLSSLNTIADNTSERVQAFSPELLFEAVDRQLSFLEQNIEQAESSGQELSEIYGATTDLQLAMSESANRILVTLSPLIVAMTNILTLILQGINALLVPLEMISKLIPGPEYKHEGVALGEWLGKSLMALIGIEENTKKEDEPLLAASKDIEDFFNAKDLNIPRMQK